MSDDKKKPNANPDAIAILNMMRTFDGRMYIWNHLQSIGVFENIFDINPIQTAYNSGMREAGLRLERDIKEHEPVYYIKMIEENI